MAPFTRREFLFLGVATGATAAVGVVLPIMRTVEGEPVATSQPALVGLFPRQSVAKVSDLMPGEPVLFDYPLAGQANMLVKLGTPVATGAGADGDLVAFSRICTHMGCVIDEYRADVNVLGPCPCHFSTFDFAHNGQVVLGQATQNLPQVLLEIDGDDIYAVGVVRLIYGFNDPLVSAEQLEVVS